MNFFLMFRCVLCSVIIDTLDWIGKPLLNISNLPSPVTADISRLEVDRLTSSVNGCLMDSWPYLRAFVKNGGNYTSFGFNLIFTQPLLRKS